MVVGRICGAILHDERAVLLIAARNEAFGTTLSLPSILGRQGVVRSNDASASRFHLIRACGASLLRLRTDDIDLYQLHEWDGLTLIEETR